MKRKIIYLQHMKMKMSNNKFKHKVNQKTEEGGFRYLINEQNNQKKINMFIWIHITIYKRKLCMGYIYIYI